MSRFGVQTKEVPGFGHPIVQEFDQDGLNDGQVVDPTLDTHPSITLNELYFLDIAWGMLDYYREREVQLSIDWIFHKSEKFSQRGQLIPVFRDLTTDGIIVPGIMGGYLAGINLVRLKLKPHISEVTTRNGRTFRNNEIIDLDTDLVFIPKEDEDKEKTGSLMYPSRGKRPQKEIEAKEIKTMANPTQTLKGLGGANLRVALTVWGSLSSSHFTQVDYDEIAARAGVSKQQVYQAFNLFQSKGIVSHNPQQSRSFKKLNGKISVWTGQPGQSVQISPEVTYSHGQIISLDEEWEKLANSDAKKADPSNGQTNPETSPGKGWALADNPHPLAGQESNGNGVHNPVVVPLDGDTSDTEKDQENDDGAPPPSNPEQFEGPALEANGSEANGNGNAPRETEKPDEASTAEQLHSAQTSDDGLEAVKASGISSPEEILAYGRSLPPIRDAASREQGEAVQFKPTPVECDKHEATDTAPKQPEEKMPGKNCQAEASLELQLHSLYVEKRRLDYEIRVAEEALTALRVANQVLPKVDLSEPISCLDDELYELYVEAERIRYEIDVAEKGKNVLLARKV